MFFFVFGNTDELDKSCMPPYIHFFIFCQMTRHPIYVMYILGYYAFNHFVFGHQMNCVLLVPYISYTIAPCYNATDKKLGGLLYKV